MTGVIGWIAGSDGGKSTGRIRNVIGTEGQRESRQEEVCARGLRTGGLVAHNFPSRSFPADVEECALDRNPDLWMYRQRTVSLLRKYLRFSLQTGRIPSMVGREFFRAKVSAYPSASFEDRVIFVSDIGKCLERLEHWDQQLIARVILQEHSQEQAAYLLHCHRKVIQRRLQEVLDILSEEFLRIGVLERLPETKGVDR